MGARGPKSSAELSIAKVVEMVPRPEPLRELTVEQADEWRAIVNRMPADWFPRETHGLLAQYCRHVVAARRVAQLVEAMESQEDFDVDEYDKLLKMQEREGRALSSLATRMRLTQQSVHDREKGKGKPKPSRKPWDES